MNVRRVAPELTSLALVLVPIAAGVAAAPLLPERMIVGWHVGLDGAVSLTRGPRLLGLAAVPAVTVVAYVALRVTRLVIDREGGVNARLFELLAHLLLGALAAAHAWLLAANL